MKKSIIAAAIAAAVAAPAANAGVVLYGKVHASIDYLDCDGCEAVWSVYSRSSRIGFKGTEDLGNGLKAIWKAETGYDFTDGGRWNASRNAYIGLAGDWGTFLYGRHDTPYKIAFYATGIDMLGDSIMDMNTLGGFEEVRASNAIAYISPNMNGLTVAAAIIPGEATLAGNGLADFYSIAAMYSNNGLNLAVAYENMEGDVPGAYGKFNEKTLVGGGYTMNNLSLSVAYAMQDSYAGVAGADMDALGVSAGYGFGNNKLILSYANQDYNSGAEVDAWGIALSHSFSKRTTGYISYADSEGALFAELTAPEMDGLSIGMIHNF